MKGGFVLAVFTGMVTKPSRFSDCLGMGFNTCYFRFWKGSYEGLGCEVE